MFNAQDLQNMQVFLTRVDLKGSESMAHAELMIKIANGIQTLTNPPAPPTEVPAPAPTAEVPITDPLPELDKE
jgi:hypothetical protein